VPALSPEKSRPRRVMDRRISCAGTNGSPTPVTTTSRRKSKVASPRRATISAAESAVTMCVGL
jgi:hypothetical protein